MLDQDTKRKIDSARDILVGKVPDPKAQVDQITTALIYKFMDDMDKEAEELGGRAGFFSGGSARYAWTKLLDKKLSGEQRLNLYTQAITSMSKNPDIPELFRDIFKGAFLPYNDPRTLTLFLKEINEFTYDHSENLGNAFEYLLSILGSQGDAGQFRTPRHIIDFIVEVIDPKKNETILDPACGTAGFLISAYKHIVNNHSDKDSWTGEMTAKKNSLTPDEKGQLTNNIVGYDISPDMVKLALVNMYLHGFVNPKIFEYDTLTSESRWNEAFDVILANPPFMTPKGGIKPHSQFAIQATRSEVLFVDYIMAHLHIRGRAGIIVPEGIIFKGENAYKRLRKKLLEDRLFAVVSLPAGVFQPYSGVKTSVLLFDNEVAKRADEILFVKIANDGFNLGAQRRTIDKNDLPESSEILKVWRSGKKQKSNLALWVKKGKIFESGDYNLIGERYREVEISKNQKWSTVKLRDLEDNGSIELGRGKVISKKDIEVTPGNYPVYSAAQQNEGEFGRYGKFMFDEELITWSVDGGGKFFYRSKHKYSVTNVCGYLKILQSDKVMYKYLYWVLDQAHKKFKFDYTYKAHPSVIREQYRISLPPLAVQKEIVEEVESKQKAIYHAKEILKNLVKERCYFGKEVKQLDGVKWVELGDKNFFQIESGGTPNTNNVKFWNGEINWATLIDLPQDNYITEIQETRRKITEQGLKNSSAKLLPAKTILVSSRATIGRVAIAKTSTATNQGFKNIIVKDESRILPFFVAAWLNSKKEKLKQLATGGTFGEVSKSKFSTIKIPLPPLAVQKRLVTEVEQEEEFIRSNKKLIRMMEAKIEKVLENI